MADTKRDRFPLPTGLVSSLPTDLLSPTDSPFLQNVRSSYGAVTPMPGRALVTSSITNEEVRGIFRSPQIDGTEWVIAILETKIYKFGSTAPGTPRTWSEITPVSTAISGVSRLWSAVTAEDKFFFTNGTGPIFVWPDGTDPVTGQYTTLDALVTSGTAPRGRFLEYYNNRLLVARTVESGSVIAYRVRWSENGDYRRWDEALQLGAGFLDFIEDDQEPIVGIKNLGDRSVIYKEHSIIDMAKTGFLVTTASPEPTFITEVRVRGVGTSSPYTIASNGLAHFFLGTDAKVYVWNGVQPVIISSEIEDRLQSAYNPFEVDKYFGLVNTRLGEYWLIMAGNVFVYDYITQRWFYDKYFTISTAAELDDSQTSETWQTITGTWQEKNITWESLRALQRTTTWIGGAGGVIIEVSDSIVGDYLGASSLKSILETPDFYIAQDPQEVAKLHRVMLLYDYKGSYPFNFSYSFDRGKTWTSTSITPNELGISVVDINASGNIVRYRLETPSSSSNFRWKVIQHEWQPEGPYIPA